MATKNGKVEHIDTLGRTDGWQNVVTGIGTSQDKKNYNQVFWNQRTPEFFEQMYAGDELASRIMNVVPEEALREWVEWIGVEKKIAKAVEKKCQQLDLRGAIERTWKWGRAYGGACLYIVTDTRDPGGPLKEGERVIGLRDLSRYDLRILTTDVESDFGAANFGHPNVYYLTVQMGSQFKGYPIHWTRMVRFDGYLVPRRTFIRNNYWHDSILNRLYNPIRNYQSSNDAVATMLQDFNVDVYKMKNLANMISAGKEDIVKKRLEILNFSKSMIRAMLLDSDDEEYENQQRSIEGVAELLTKQANRLVAATDIPHTKLLGESPDGSNATGNSTTQQWYNHVRAEQNNYLRPKLRRLMEVIFYDVEDLDFKFNSLHQNTEMEEAEIRNKTAQTDQIYLSTGVIDPTEVAESRFGSGEYSMETKLNLEAREAGLLTPHGGETDIPDPTDPSDPMGNPEDPSQDPSIPPEPPKSGALKPKVGQTAQADDETFPTANTALPEGSMEPATKLNAVGGPDASHLKVEQDEDEEEDLPESLKEVEPDEMGIETDRPGTGFELKNTAIPSKTKKVEQLVGITMSEPMRDPKTDPRLPAPNTAKKRREISPQIGNAMTSPSGAQFKTDAGAMEEQIPMDDKWITMNGTQVEVGNGGKHESGPLKGQEHKPKGAAKKKPAEGGHKASASAPSHGGGSHHGGGLLEALSEGAEKAAQAAEHDRQDAGVAATMREFKKGKLKSGSGAKVTDPKQAIAIGMNDKVEMSNEDYLKEHARLIEILKSGNEQEKAEARRQMKEVVGQFPNLKDAASVAVMYKDTILMGKRKDSGKWTLPGGHLKKDEAPHLGALRELQEETGIKAMPHQLDDMEASDLENGGKLHKFVLRLGGPKPTTARMDPDGEVAQWIWVPTHGGLPTHVKENLHHNPNGVLDALGL